jgi:ACS family hexuronate transporter-like MFS transporter
VKDHLPSSIKPLLTHYRWVVVGFAFLAVIITYLDRSALSYAITPLKLTFGLSNTDFGLIAAAFGVGYMIMTVIGGVIVDQYGSRRIWTLFAILWSVACALLGLASGIAWLVVFRLLLGVAEGPSFPAMTRVTADWLPISERARSLAIGLAAVPFASVIGAPLVSHLVAGLGWRWMFLILGFLGIVWGIAWYVIFRDHPRDSRYVSAAEADYIESHLLAQKQVNTSTQKTTWKFMLFNRAFLANNYAFFAFGYLLFFAITWLPWLTATVLLLLGGVISDWLYAKTNSIRIARSHLIWICQVLSALCFIPVVMSHSLTVAMISISLGVGFGMMPNAAFYAINQDLAHDRAGTSLGIMDCAFAAAGILAPFVTGWLSGVTGNFSAAIALMIGLTFSSALAVFLFQHPDELLLKNPAS